MLNITYFSNPDIRPLGKKLDHFKVKSQRGGVGAPNSDPSKRHHLSVWNHIHFFLRSKCCKIYTFLSVFGQNATIYIYTFWGFLGSKCCNIHTFVSFFWGQNDTIYTHFVFFLSKCCYIYTFCFFLVKMLQHMHICVGFGIKCYHIYTFFGGGGGVKMLPYIHISGI